MADEVKTKLTVEGAEALQELERIRRAEQEHAESIDKTGQAAERTGQQTREAAKANDEQSEAVKAGERSNQSFRSTLGNLTKDLDGVTFGLASMAGGMMGVGGLVAAFEASNEAAEKTIERLQKIVDLANEAARATLDLHAVNQIFDEGEEGMVESLSSMTGRGFSEMAGLLTQFRSSNAHLDREQQDKLIEGSLVPLMMSTDKDPSSLAKFIGRVSSTTTDPREINNLVNESISLAGEGDPSAFLGAAGELLVSGKTAGMESAETLALLGFSSGKFETAESKTMLRNVFGRLSADPTVRGKVEGMGVSTEGDPLDIIRRMQAAGFGGEQTVELFGLENARVVDAIMAEMATVDRFVGQTQAAVQGPDQANAFLRDLTENSPRHANALKILQQQQELAALERGAGEQAQDYQIARNAVEFELEEAVQRSEIDASAKEARLEEFDRLAAGGPNFRKRVRGTLRDKYDPDTPLDQIDYDDVLLEAARLVSEGGGLASDLLPGGNSSTPVPLRDAVQEALDGGPAIPAPSPISLRPAEREGRQGTAPQSQSSGSAGNTTTIINNFNGPVNTSDPVTADLDGRDR